MHQNTAETVVFCNGLCVRVCVCVYHSFPLRFDFKCTAIRQSLGPHRVETKCDANHLHGHHKNSYNGDDDDDGDDGDDDNNKNNQMSV